MCGGTGFVAVDRDDRRAVGGGARAPAAGVPGVLGVVVAVGIRALARGADAARHAVGEAAAGVLWWLWRHARPVPGLAGAAPARRGGGNRRGTAAGGQRRGASPDRQRARPAAGNGSWLAASRPGEGGEPAGVRDPTAGRARSRTRRGHAGQQHAGRGGDAGCPRVCAAIRSRRRPVGACGVPGRRTATRSPAAPAVAYLARGRAPVRDQTGCARNPSRRTSEAQRPSHRAARQGRAQRAAKRRP